TTYKIEPSMKLLCKSHYHRPNCKNRQHGSPNCENSHLTLYHRSASFGNHLSIVYYERDRRIGFDDLEFCDAYWSDKVDYVTGIMEGNRIAVQLSLLRND